MRTIAIVLLSVLSASTIASAKSDGSRNSLETLLDRIEHNKTGTSASPGKTAKSFSSAEAKDEDEPADSTPDKRDLVDYDDAPTAKMIKRNRAKQHEKNAKRWAELILQDEAVSSAARRPATSLTTPAARKSSLLVHSTQRMTTTPGAVHTPAEKRWIWANSVIQDDTPASEVPPVGNNVNQLGETASTVSTPQASLVAPTFPALSSAIETASPVPTSALVAEAAAATPGSATTSPPTPSPAPTSSALAWWDPTEFFNDLEAGFSKLFGLDDEETTSPSATAAPTVTAAEVEKRWVWATGIIQDDTPNAPPVGDNVNMLNPTPVGADTASFTLVAPSFPPQAPGAAPSMVVSAAAPPPVLSSAPFVEAGLANASASSNISATASTTKRLSRLEIARARARHSAASTTGRMAKVKRGHHA